MSFRRTIFPRVTGLLDFVMGASMSSGGKSIIVTPSRSLDGQTSRIRLNSSEGSIVIPNGYVSSVISEFGMINLFKNYPAGRIRPSKAERWSSNAALKPLLDTTGLFT